MASGPFVDAWGASDPEPEWSMPFNDLPDPRRLVACKGCPGASSLKCCSPDPVRIRARQLGTFAKEPEANGARGRRRREFFYRWLRRQETT